MSTITTDAGPPSGAGLPGAPIDLSKKSRPGESVITTLLTARGAAVDRDHDRHHPGADPAGDRLLRRDPVRRLLRHRGPVRRHPADHRRRSWSRSSRCWSRCRSVSARRCTSPSTPRPGSARCSSRPSSCWPASRRSSTASSRSTSSPRRCSRTSSAIDVGFTNALAAGLVLGVMILPTVASLSEDAFSAVPQALRQGSLAMGANRMQTTLRVVLPAALSGVAAAVVLGMSRAVGRDHDRGARRRRPEEPVGRPARRHADDDRRSSRRPPAVRTRSARRRTTRSSPSA